MDFRLVRLPAIALSLVLAIPLLGSRPASAASPLASGRASTPAEDQAPFREAIALERQAFALLETDPLAARARYLEAAARFAGVAESSEGDGMPFWRAARCRWFAGEVLPLEDKRERLAAFEAARDLAARGIAADPVCAECMLWKFIAMGRIATNRGLVAGMRSAAEMAGLLERGIALNPTRRDGDDNSTLGNLHYGSAIFYRVLPDWTWLGWLLGVRGDKERALQHARTALALHPARVDYQVELASQLLCLGTSRDRPERLEEGVAILQQLLAREVRSLRDERQLAAAEIMLAAPEKSCGYTGDAWVEIDARDAAALSD